MSSRGQERDKEADAKSGIVSTKPATFKSRAFRCCQSNVNPSPIFADQQVLGDEKVAPLAKGGVSFLFEPDSGVDVPFEVEVIVH